MQATPGPLSVSPPTPAGPSSVSPPAQQPSTVTADETEAAAVVRQRGEVAMSFHKASEAAALAALRHTTSTAKQSHDKLQRNKAALDSIRG